MRKIEEHGRAVGLTPNVFKSEVISHDRSVVEAMISNIPGLKFTEPQDATLLGSPLGCNAMADCLNDQLHRLKVVRERLCHLAVHDVITILRHCFSIPKLLYVLRMTPAFSSSGLQSWDEQLLSIVSRIMNIDFRPGDPAWLQATLAVGSGGLGFRSGLHLAPSAFLASAAGASALMQQLLPPHLASISYCEQHSALSVWHSSLPEETLPPTGCSRNKQKSWDKQRVDHVFHSLLHNCKDEVSKARLLAASCIQSGAWLNAPPVSSLGLRMSNDTIRIATGLRVGAAICQKHACAFCGMEVDQLGYHGLSCVSSQGRIVLHNSVNNVIYHWQQQKCLLAWSHPDCISADGNRPDGITVIPWSEGKFLVWDATCVDTFCQSHRRRCSEEAGAAGSICRGGEGEEILVILITGTSSSLLPRKPLAQLVRIPCPF